jgi:type I restriction enzyme S subunit
MVSNWDVLPLRELIEEGRTISYGIVQPGPFVSDGVPIIRVTDVRDGRVATDSPLRVDHKVESAHKRTRLAGGELLLTLVGTVGESAVAPKALAGWNTARAVGVIPIRQDVTSYWVSLVLKTPAIRELILSRLNTTVQATLNLKDLAELPIVVPPAAERESIIRILGALDDKIELNRKMSATLEAMARALFTSWFVDFGPVRARSEGRDTGLASDLHALFPDALTLLDGLPIPSGWGMATLADLADIRGGTQLPTAECTISGPCEVFGANGIMGYTDRHNHPAFVIAFGRVGANCGSVHWSYRPSWINNNASAVVPHAYPEYVLQSLLNVDFVSMRTGSAQPFIPNSSLSSTPILRPPNNVMEAYCDVIRPLRLRQVASQSESRTVEALRDALLPRLISGELRVPDAECIMEQSA